MLLDVALSAGVRVEVARPVAAEATNASETTRAASSTRMYVPMMPPRWDFVTPRLRCAPVRWNVLLVLIATVLAGCGGSGHTIPADDLGRVVLRPADLPGFE